MKRWQVAVGSLSSWSGWVIASVLVIRLITALVSDPNRTQNFSPLWLALWFISVAAMATLVHLVMLLGFSKALKAKPRPWANLALVGTAGALGNAIVGYLALKWGLDTEQLWHIRLLGGFLGHAFMFLSINVLRANLIQRNESIRKLTQTEQQLLGFRDSTKQIIQDEVESLKQKTRDALLPAIEKIQSLLNDKAEYKAELIQDLKTLIHEDVRPLSKQILQEAANFQTHQTEAPKPGYRNLFTTNYSLKRTIRPLIGLPFLAAFYPMIEFLMVDHRSALRGLLGALATALTLKIIKTLIPTQTQVKATFGAFLHTLIATAAIAPTWWLMYQEYGNTESILMATFVIWIITVLSALVLAASLAIELNQAKYAQTLIQFTEELQKEVALFEQKLSLEKRTWSRIVHGEVQAALTAAATRLQMHDKPEPYQIEMVKQDLNRAKEFLVNPPQETTNFNQSLQEITLTWKSICQINTQISARAQRAIDQNQDTRLVTNEIIKEAVSNAVRHGQAKTINIKLDRIQDDILDIEISNDGHKPLRDKTPGLGSQLLDELTLTWSLEIKNNKTTLTAKVPISKS